MASGSMNKAFRLYLILKSVELLQHFPKMPDEQAHMPRINEQFHFRPDDLQQLPTPTWSKDLATHIRAGSWRRRCR